MGVSETFGDDRMVFDRDDARMQFIYLRRAMTEAIDALRRIPTKRDEFTEIVEEEVTPNSDEIISDHVRSQAVQSSRMESLMLNAFLLSVYATLEFSLARMHENYTILIGRVESPISGRIPSFLQTVGKLKAMGGSRYLFETSEWKEIEVLKALRDLIAHRNGLIDREGDEGGIRSVFENRISVVFEQWGYSNFDIVCVQDLYLRYIIRVTEKFVDEVHDFLKRGLENAHP